MTSKRELYLRRPNTFAEHFPGAGVKTPCHVTLIRWHQALPPRNAQERDRYQPPADRRHQMRSKAAWLSAGIATVMLAAVPAPVFSQERTSGVVTGRVVDQDSEDPVPGAQVSLVVIDSLSDPPEISTVADLQGAFRFDNVSDGSYWVVTQSIGYPERSDSVEVPAGAFVDMVVSLPREAIELEEIVVTVGSVLLARQGFYDRKRQGFRGTFVDRLEIEKKRPAAITDLFQDMRGLTVVWGGIYGGHVFMNQRSSLMGNLPGCRPQIWLDGIRSTMESLDVMRVEEVEGIEVYRGAAPGKFTDPCGTIAIWTRRIIRQ